VVPEKDQAGWKRELVESCRELGLDLTESQVQAFETYWRLIRRWNQLADLVSPGDLSRLMSRHFMDSLSLLRLLVPLPGTRVLDVGSGGGFPGLPVKICCPRIDLTLLEPREKPWFFLHEAVSALSLRPVTLLRERAQNLQEVLGAADRFDLVLARALAPLERLIRICFPLVRPGGLLVAYKGRRARQEMVAAGEIIQQAGGRTVAVPVRVPGLSAKRYLILMQRP
jgi:16S rRNA (guanine527-N7)-methyltransferase